MLSSINYELNFTETAYTVDNKVSFRIALIDSPLKTDFGRFISLYTMNSIFV